MLNFYFFQYPADLPPLEPEQSFRIIGYAQAGEYTLVKWRLHFGFDVPNGDNLESESLYRGKELLGSDRLEGNLPLYQAPEPMSEGASVMPEIQVSVWDQMDAKIGTFGVPPAIAIALRDPKNYVCFDPNTSFV